MKFKVRTHDNSRLVTIEAEEVAVVANGTASILMFKNGETPVAAFDGWYWFAAEGSFEVAKPRRDDDD